MSGRGQELVGSVRGGSNSESAGVQNLRVVVLELSENQQIFVA